MLPIPNAATAVRNAKSTPSHFCRSPRSRTYIGPPAIRPEGVTIRYFTASNASLYFVAMPNTPVSHIQSTAPGPPAATAVATPTMLPVPIVAARAVVRAPNWLTSPFPSDERPREIRIPLPIYLWMNRRRKVRTMCVPNRRMSRGYPQIRSLRFWRKSSTDSITEPDFWWMGLVDMSTKNREKPSEMQCGHAGLRRIGPLCATFRSSRASKGVVRSFPVDHDG